MSFSAAWLSLREPHDMRARSPAVLSAVIGAFEGRQSIRIADLGCGTGSTLRALLPRLQTEQEWRLIDYDRALLARAAENSAALDVHVTTVAADLNRDLEAALKEPADLVTTSALLDLVSETWIERLADCAASRGMGVYAALSYDGRVEIVPAHALDAAVADAVNLHQRGDKGFGPALGPAAADVAISKFMQRGFSVVHGPADWIASQEDRAFQNELVGGWAEAARETGIVSSKDVSDWLSFRRGEIAEGRSSLRVGHVDFFAAPPSR